MEHDLLQSEKGILEYATLNSTKCNSVSIVHVHSITHSWHPTSVIVSFHFILISYSNAGQGNEISWTQSLVS